MLYIFPYPGVAVNEVCKLLIPVLSFKLITGSPDIPLWPIVIASLVMPLDKIPIEPDGWFSLINIVLAPSLNIERSEIPLLFK